MAKVLFIYPDIRKDIPRYSGKYSPGIGVLSACLKKHGHQVSLFHVTREINFEELKGKVTSYQSDLVAFSSMTNMFPYVKRWSAWVKKFSNIPTICGGIHPTVDPEDSISTDGLDMICLGEGEKAIVELAERITNGQNYCEIQSTWIKKNGRIVKNKVAPLCEDLDSLPFEYRDIFDFKNLVDSKQGQITFTGTRGCYYGCSYCANHVIKSIYPNKRKYVRFRSPSKFIDEIEQIVKKYEFCKYICFTDDIFISSVKWLEEFAKEYKKRINLPFNCNVRANLINKRVVSLLRQANCKSVDMGVESGNDVIRNEILNRHLKTEDIMRAFKLCHDAGLKIITYNMVGLPRENRDAILETIKLNAKGRVFQTWRFIFYPYPGTKIFQLYKDKIKDGRRFSSYQEGSILFNDNISEKEIIFFHRYFNFLTKLYERVFSLRFFKRDLLSKCCDRILLSKKLPVNFLVFIYDLAYKIGAFSYNSIINKFFNRLKTRYE